MAGSVWDRGTCKDESASMDGIGIGSAVTRAVIGSLAASGGLLSATSEREAEASGRLDDADTV